MNKVTQVLFLSVGYVFLIAIFYFFTSIENKSYDWMKWKDADSFVITGMIISIVFVVSAFCIVTDQAISPENENE